MQGTKEVNSPCRLSIPATDFYVCARDKYFCVYVKGKEERNQGRKAGSKPCGLAHTDTGFWIYGRYTDFSALCERKIGRTERKEGGDNPCGLWRHRFLCTLVLNS